MKQDRDGGWRIEHLFGRSTTAPETFREWVEERVQIATDQAQAAQAVAREQQALQLEMAIAEVAARLTDQSERRFGTLLLALRESIEQRIQIGTDQAISHADQGVSAMAGALKGVAKALTSFKRQVELAAFVKQEDMAATAAALQTELYNIRSALDKEVEGRAGLSARVGSINDQIEAVAADIGTVTADWPSLVKRDDLTAGAAALEMDLAEIRSALHQEVQDRDGVNERVASLNNQIEAVAADIRSLTAALGSVVKQEDIVATAAILEAQLATVRSTVEKEIGDQANLHGRIGSLNNQIESVAADIGAAISDYNSQLRSVEKRVEFVRQETMYELQASIARLAGTEIENRGRVAARILNPEKIDKMRSSGIRLNIGCGHIQHDDYINIDARELPGVDIVSEATGIPFKAGEIAEIASAHLVEHFTSHILDRVILPYWKSLLKSGGQLTTVAPDGAAMLSAVHDGIMSFDDFREVLFGGQDYDGDFHYNLITPDSYNDVLQRAGFIDIETVYSEKRNGKCFEFKIVARKP